MNDIAQPAQALSPSRRKRRQQPKGRQVDPAALARVRGLIADLPTTRDTLIEALHRLQDADQCLKESALVALAACYRVALAEVYEVATFYHHFHVVPDHLAPDPAHPIVRVCTSLSCSIQHGNALLDAFQDQDGIRLEAVPCVGRCAQAPIAVVGQHPVEHATPERIQSVLNARRYAAPPLPDALRLQAYREQGGYQLLQRCVNAPAVQADAPVSYSREDAIQILEQSGLRGLGGAGFPAGRKWRIVSQEPGPRLMAVNIDEGEPGTFKDRHYLERDPHRFLEGMLIAAWAVNIQTIYIYLRDEYASCRQLLEQELDALRRDPPIPDLPTIHLRRGAGAYICGEESAMIESIEGKRGMPRLRPPYIAQKGLFGRPTLEHNFETLYWVRDLLEDQGRAFLAEGRHGRKGWRSFSLSGRVQRPGVYLAPAGITVRELIDEYGGGMLPGHTLQAYLPGGASGGILPASLDHLPLDFDTLQEYGCFIGSAAVIVLSQHDDLPQAACNLMAFFKDESCGQCTPCRVGTERAHALISAGNWDAERLGDLSAVMRDASICGLGQAAPNPIESVIRYFPHTLPTGDAR
ncbi:MAG: NAD(P)H-dependent oxidoreductase subunit E [Pigmentiphaga sp.]|nr:NAD(P)H-dependent oxidoreductase subunit E [Pigmentiphaga sp.]